MRRIFLIFILSVFCTAVHSERVVLNVCTELGSSYMTDFIGGGYVMSELNLAPNVLYSGGLQKTTEKKIAAYLANEIKIPYKELEIRLMQQFFYSSYVWNIRETMFIFVAGTKFGRFDTNLGASARVITPSGSFKNSIFERFNLQYDFGVSVFANPQKWNLRLGASNYDMFLFERIEAIMFSLKGDYSFSDKWGVFCKANLRPAGNFHLSANYYSFYFQTGVRWAIF